MYRKFSTENKPHKNKENNFEKYKPQGLFSEFYAITIVQSADWLKLESLLKKYIKSKQFGNQTVYPRN